MDRLGAALAGLTERVNVGDDAGAVGVGLMLWTTPVAMMIAMFARIPGYRGGATRARRSHRSTPLSTQFCGAPWPEAGRLIGKGDSMPF